MDCILLLIFGCVVYGFHRLADMWLCVGFIVLLIVDCVLHGLRRVVDMWLCVAWVVSCC